MTDVGFTNCLSSPVCGRYSKKQGHQALSHSVGGKTTKRQMAWGGLSKLLPHVALTGGHVHDSKPALSRMSALPGQVVGSR